MNVETLLAQLSKEEYCYLTTTGRVTGRPHEIEIWFGIYATSVYMLSGSKASDWVRNIAKNPAVSVRIGNQRFQGTGRMVKDKEEEQRARYMIAEKYQEWEEGRTLSQWAQTALPIAIDIDSLAAQ